MDTILLECQEKMDKCINNYNENLTTLRTGRASAALIENLKCDYYGDMMNITQIATVKIPEPRQLLIIPYDQNDIKSIVAAINASNLGINPIIDGNKLD